LVILELLRCRKISSPESGSAVLPGATSLPVNTPHYRCMLGLDLG
jgi:hypothetical protein